VVSRCQSTRTAIHSKFINKKDKLNDLPMDVGHLESRFFHPRSLLMTTATPPIEHVLRAFAAGDVPALLAHVADDVDLRIDHYRDDADTRWQVATSKADLLGVLQRLATDVFPQGTRLIETESRELGSDWVLTRFHQQFFYAVQQRTVASQTWILSHSVNGQVDYFRETVATITPTAP